MKKNLIKKEICKHCVNWDMNSKSALLHYDLPKEYPKEVQLTTYLIPTEVTFNTLKFVVETATKKLMSGCWSEKNIIAYCATNCINTAGVDQLI